MTDRERIALILGQEDAKWQARRWHAETIAPHVVYVYDPHGKIAAMLDDRSEPVEARRSPLDLLRAGVAMAEACERLECQGGVLAIEHRAERMEARHGHPGRKPVALMAAYLTTGPVAGPDPFAGSAGLVCGVPPFGGRS